MGKKVVILSGLKIFPNESGGHLRTGGVAKGLARLGHQVKIFSLAGRARDYRFSEGYVEQAVEEGLFEEVHLGLLFGLAQTLFRRLGFPRLWQYVMLKAGILPFRLRKTLREADWVICDFPFTPALSVTYPKKAWTLLSHNLEHQLMRRGNRWERILAPWMERIERLAPLRYHSIFACATEDLEFFRENDIQKSCSVVLLGNGIDPETFAQAHHQRQSLRRQWGLNDDDWLIVFSGSRFQPNLEAMSALREFCRREALFLHENRIFFLILGSIYPMPIREGQLIMTGKVPDTVPYFTAADAALNPVLRGSGSNLKIFEYLAARLPVISTGFGLRGTKLRAGEDCMLFEGDELRSCLDELLIRRSKDEWRVFADGVWERHGAQSDIRLLVADAVRQLPLASRSGDRVKGLTEQFSR